MKKNSIVISIIGIFVLILVSILYYTYPNPYTFSVEGVKYQLGNDNKDYIRPVTIEVVGTLQRSLTGVKTFKGKINIEGETLPIPEHERKLTITFGKNTPGLMIYNSYEKDTPPFYTYGDIYINNDFSEISICVYQHEGSDPAKLASGSWSGVDGLVISAPAHNRAEGLAISSELMKKLWPKTELE